MSVSYNKNALWQKLEQDIHEDFYQEYYPKQSLFHREKVWLEDVRELNGEIVEKVAKALLKYETKWLGKLEEELRREEELERQSQQLLAGKRKKPMIQRPGKAPWRCRRLCWTKPGNTLLRRSGRTEKIWRITAG